MTEFCNENSENYQQNQIILNFSNACSHLILNFVSVIVDEKIFVLFLSMICLLNLPNPSWRNNLFTQVFDV